MSKTKFYADHKGLQAFLRGIEMRNAASNAVNRLGSSTGIHGRVSVTSGKTRAQARYTTDELTWAEKKQFKERLKGVATRRRKFG